MSIKQVDAVVSIVTSLEGFQPGVKLTDAQRAEALQLIVDGLTSGEIDMSEKARAKYSEPKAMKTYASGLLTNWLNKSPALNGGIKYQAKNPGSRTGSVEYKQAIALKRHLESTGAEIPAELAEFIEANKPVKAEAKKELDLSSLPEELKQLVG